MFNATELAAGTYTGNVTINSNDPDESAIVVPIALEVGATIPDPVNDLQIEYAGSNVLLSWSAVPGATLYHVYECDTPYGTFVETGTTTATEIIRPLSAGKFYRVTSDN